MYCLSQESINFSFEQCWLNFKLLSESTLLWIIYRNTCCFCKKKKKAIFKVTPLTFPEGVSLSCPCWCCSVARLCPTLCNPMNCSMPGFPVLRCLLEFAQTHVHWAGDDTQPSHPLSPPSSSALNLSQHQGHFQWLGSSLLSGGQSIGASASFLPMNIQGWFLFRFTDVISLQSKGLLRVFYSNTTSALSLLCPHLN